MSNLEAHPSVVEQADDVLNSYAEEQFHISYAKLKEKMDGDGCCCPNCKKAAISEVNSWVLWVVPEGCDPTRWLSYLDEKGDIQRGEPPCRPPIQESETDESPV